MENKKIYTAPEFTVEELNETDIVLMSIVEGEGSLPGTTFPGPKNGLNNVRSDW